MYGGVVLCPECDYEFYCETVNTEIDCPRCGKMIALPELPKKYTTTSEEAQ